MALCVVALGTDAAVGSSGHRTTATSPPNTGFVRLPGEVALGVGRALARGALHPAAATAGERAESMTLTVVLRRSDPQRFDRFLAAVQDPRSATYRHFLRPHQLAARFGPSLSAYESVVSWLRSEGFRLVQGSADRLTLTVTGTRAQAERAFKVNISDYRTGSGRRLYANTSDPAVPAALAGRIAAISGLSDAGKPQGAPAIEGIKLAFCTAAVFIVLLPEVPEQPYNEQDHQRYLQQLAEILRLLGKECAGLDLPAPPGSSTSSAPAQKAATQAPAAPAVAQPGSGQKIGLLEFASLRLSDVQNYLGLVGQKTFANFSQTAVDGGAGPPSGAGESEALLDADLALTTAPGAKVVAYDGAASATYEQMFNAMISDGDTVISNSWSSCEDQVSEAEADSINEVLATAAAAGISVLNGSGDSGSTCLDGSPNTIGVPADSPNATAVGGTSVNVAADGTVASERWWNGSGASPPTGQGGFGVSRYFSRPGYQDGLSSATARSIPDVALAADPANTGYMICQADAGGCPNGLRYGGTSASTPLMAAFVAVLNQRVGKKLGALNPVLYPLAGTQGFHSAASMDSDFAHVGLGSPDVDRLALALKGAKPGPPSAAESSVADTRFGQVPADGTTSDAIEVQVTDANGNLISGQNVTLTPSGGSSHILPGATVATDQQGATAVFHVTDSAPESVTYTAKDAGDSNLVLGSVTVDFTPPVATGAQITSNLSSVPSNGTGKATITVYLQNGLAEPAAGKTVTLAQNGKAVITPAGSSAPGDTAVTDSAGDATFEATDTSTESVDFTATDSSDNLPVPGGAAVNFGPSSADCAKAVPKAKSGFSASAFATGFAYNTQADTYPGNFTEGACTEHETAPAFDASGNAYVSDTQDGTIHVLGPAGGTPSPANQLPDANFANGALDQLAFGKDGSLYASLTLTGDDVRQPEIVQLDPVSGAVIRVVASSSTGLPDCPFALVVDPLSGDLFTDDDCSSFAASNQISRIHDPSSNNPTVSDYITTGGCNLGLSFAPNGTLYLANCNGEVDSIGATNTTNPKVTKVASVTGAFSVAVTASNGAGKATELEAFSDAGVATAVNLTNTPAVATTAASGKAPFFITAAGANRCGYATIPGAIVKVGPSSCSSAAVAGPQIILKQTGSAAPSLGTGSSVSFTATLKNDAGASGRPVDFVVNGPNANLELEHASAGGQATLSYIGARQGVDTVSASAVVGGKTVSSAPLQLHWTADRDVTALYLNTSPEAGPVGTPSTVTAELQDLTTGSPLADAPVTITVESQSCGGTTDASGVATCALTPAGGVGMTTLEAGYGGDTGHLASSAINIFDLLPAAPPPPPPPPGPPSPVTPAPVPPSPAPTGGAPVNTALPQVSGTPTPGNSLSCSTGTWTNAPAGFAYRWRRNGNAIGRATGPRYTVQIADEAQSLSCVVTASNTHGTGAPATSAGVLVALPGTTRCPKPTGKLSGGSLGPLKLGMSKAKARHKLRRFGVTHNAFDNFCLFAGWGIRAGYPSRKLLSSLSRAQRRRVSPIILLLTANPHYAYRETRPGAKLTKSLSKQLHLGKVLHVGSNSWYISAGKPADGVLKVRNGIVQEVGVAQRQLLSGRGAQRRFLKSFSSA